MERNDCHGQCLIRIASGQHVRYRACVFSCLPRKCANHVICGQWETQHTLDMHGGACLSCVRRFGKKLDIVEDKSKDEECAVCYGLMDVAPCLPQCTHRFCVDCFRVLNKVPEATEASNGHDVLEVVPVRCLSWTDANTDQAASAACPMCRAKHWLWRREPVLHPMVVMAVPRFNPNPVADASTDEPVVKFKSLGPAWNPKDTISFKGLNAECYVEKARDDGAVEETNVEVEPRHTVSIEQLNAGLYANEVAHYERVSGSDGWAKFRLKLEREWIRDANVAGPPRAIGLHELQPGQYVYTASAVPTTDRNLVAPRILDWRIATHEPGIIRPFGNNMHLLTDARKEVVVPPLDEQEIVRTLEKTYIKTPNGRYLATPNSLLALLGAGRKGVEKRGDHVIFTDEATFNAVFEESKRKMARSLGIETHIPIGARIVNTTILSNNGRVTGRPCAECQAPAHTSCTHRDVRVLDWRVKGGDTVASPTPGDIRWEIRDREEHIRHIRRLREVKNGFFPSGEMDPLVLKQHLEELQAAEDDLSDASHAAAHPRSTHGVPPPSVPQLPRSPDELANMMQSDDRCAECGARGNASCSHRQTRYQMEARRAYANSLLKSIPARAVDQPADIRDALNATVAQLEGIARHIDIEKEQLAADRAALARERQQLADDRAVLVQGQINLGEDRAALRMDQIKEGTWPGVVGHATSSARPGETFKMIHTKTKFM